MDLLNLLDKRTFNLILKLSNGFPSEFLELALRFSAQMLNTQSFHEIILFGREQTRLEIDKIATVFVAIVA